MRNIFTESLEGLKEKLSRRNQSDSETKIPWTKATIVTLISATLALTACDKKWPENIHKDPSLENPVATQVMTGDSIEKTLEEENISEGVDSNISNEETWIEKKSNDLKIIFSKFDKYKNDENIETLLTDAVLQNPEDAFQYFENYKNEPYAKNILLLAATEKPEYLFTYYNVYKNEKYTQEIVDLFKNTNL